ncbi:MAG: hypothetical protein H0V00_15725, partial [Chloroflexia bacterium]|nr:hypothetical protein [Chloroflexia bacterium]
MSRLFPVCLSLVLAVVVLLSSAPLAVEAQEATPGAEGALATLDPVAVGLTNPRGFTWAEDGTLYVALAGTGGSNLPTEEADIIEAF